MKRDDLAEATRFAFLLCEMRPYSETHLRTLLSLLDLDGDRARAIQTYNVFVANLARELGVGPSPETVALLDSIRRRTSVRQLRPI